MIYDSDRSAEDIVSDLSVEDIARLAINPDLTCDILDPRNSRYTVPFWDAAREQMAHAMADASYSAVADEFDDNTTQGEADQRFEECLVDARRMMCDPDYMRLFGGDAVASEMDHEMDH